MCEPFTEGPHAGHEPLVRVVVYHDMKKDLPVPATIKARLLQQVDQAMEDYRRFYYADSSGRPR